jgi:hypothetical protein
LGNEQFIAATVAPPAPDGKKTGEKKPDPKVFLNIAPNIGVTQRKIDSIAKESPVGHLAWGPCPDVHLWAEGCKSLS